MQRKFGHCIQAVQLLLVNFFSFPDMVSFIDFEYTGLNWMAYDIANHFCEYAGKCLWLLKVNRDGDKNEEVEEYKKERQGI